MEVGSENNVSMEIHPSPSRITSMPSTPQPLQPISSERQNQQRLPYSPSLPSNLDGSNSPLKSHQPRLSDVGDVKARIAHINSIAQTGSPTRSMSPTKSSVPTSSHAAIQRAILGREEAEATLAGLQAQLESSKARERLVSERVETLMEQLSEARSRQRHERAVYEKEIKHTKKAEYKAEMAVIKLQEDLREVRSELEACKARSDHEKTEKDKARQEAFERAYVVAGMTEELQELKRRLEVTEQEKDAALAMAANNIVINTDNLKETMEKVEIETANKRKNPTSTFDIAKLDEIGLDAPGEGVEIKCAVLQMEVDFLRRQLQENQETIHFMNMQCQFKACPCRMAEREGVRFVHDYEHDAKVRERNAKRRKMEDLEPQLPLPKFKSWIQEREEAKGKQPATTHSIDVKQPPQQIPEEVVESNEVALEAGTGIEMPEAPLPPSEIQPHTAESTDQNDFLEEAANLPLPPLKPTEIDSSDETPEPTAQLEELTQVIVEPDNSMKNFIFSTSLNGNKAVAATTDDLRQSHNIRMSDDLFDISPPKRHMPQRPSTALGILTVQSPIRLVPNSPQVVKQQSIDADDNDLRQHVMTRVALNDTSPVRQSRRQNRPVRPNARDRSRGRSPTPHRTTDFDRASPAPSTLFPITPVVKHERYAHSEARTQPRPQTSQDHYSNNLKEISTTTSVPLRTHDDQSTDLTIDATSMALLSSATPFSVPGTPNMTREAALAQIRARRDRARSINMRKSAEEGSKTPGSAARRGVNLKDRLGDAKGRDFSQASAPGRI